MEKQVNGGATLWARKTLGSEIFEDKPDKWFKIWFFIVNSVSFRARRKLKRGQGLFKYEGIIDRTGATRDQVKHCIEYLKKEKMIATQKATRGFFITVLNYDTYQTIDTYKSPTESHTKAPLYNKKGNNVEELYKKLYKMWPIKLERKTGESYFRTLAKRGLTEEVFAGARGYAAYLKQQRSGGFDQTCMYISKFLSPSKERWKEFIDFEYKPPL